MARLDDILDANRRVTPLPDDGKSRAVEATRELCVITCVDPRLARFFPAALGLERGDAVIVRLPGAQVTTGHGDGLRAVAAAVYINGATELLVLGHTDCGTTRIDTSAITSRMASKGVAPASMPGGVREFLGAVGDMRQALKASAAAIRSAPFLPRDLLVHAAILDVHTGALEVVERGEPLVGKPDAGSEALGYQPGPTRVLGDAMGDGASILAATSPSTLYSGLSALAPSSGAEPAQGIDLGFKPPPEAPSVSPMASDWAKGQQAAATAPHPTPARARARLTPAMEANLAKVRDFFRMELTLDQRRRASQALALALASGRDTGELTQIVLKPVLDAGQKRYRVIDELVAIKETVAPLEPDRACELLSHLLD